MSDAVLRGRRTFSNGTFASDEGQRRIDEMLRSMRLIADIGDGVPSFYVDDCGVFWMHSESEQYESTLQAIERSEIEACYPTVDPVRPLSA